MATLDDVLAEIKNTSKEETQKTEDVYNAVKGLDDSMNRFLKYLKDQNLDKLEAERERQRLANLQAQQQFRSTSSSDYGGMGLLTPFLNTAAAFLSPLGSFAAAVSGLGPNLRDLKNVGKIGKTGLRPITIPGASLVRTVEDWFTKTRNSILKRFGLTPTEIDKDGRIRAATPNRYGLKPYAKSIPDQIIAKFDDLKKTTLKNMGLVEGKDGVLRFAKTPVGMTIAAQSMSPEARMALGKAAQVDAKSARIGVGLWGHIAKLFNFTNAWTKTNEALLKSVQKAGEMTGLGGVGKILVKFLRPIAFIFSAIEGLREAERQLDELDETDPTKSDLSKYFEGGIGGFVSGFAGDFIGMFANLIKAIPVWMFKKAFPEAVDADGNIIKKDGAGIQNLLANMQGLDFVKLIKDAVMAPFKFIGDSLEYFLDSMSDDPKRNEQAKKWRENFLNFDDPNSGIRKLVDAIFTIPNALMDAAVTLMFGKDSEIGKKYTGNTFSEKVAILLKGIWDLIPKLPDVRKFIYDMLPPAAARFFFGEGDPGAIRDRLTSNVTQIESFQNQLKLNSEAYENIIGKEMEILKGLDPSKRFIKNQFGYETKLTQEAADRQKAYFEKQGLLDAQGKLLQGDALLRRAAELNRASELESNMQRRQGLINQIRRLESEIEELKKQQEANGGGAAVVGQVGNNSTTTVDQKNTFFNSTGGNPYQLDDRAFAVAP